MFHIIYRMFEYRIVLFGIPHHSYYSSHFQIFIILLWLEWVHHLVLGFLVYGVMLFSFIIRNIFWSHRKKFESISGSSYYTIYPSWEFSFLAFLFEFWTLCLEYQRSTRSLPSQDPLSCYATLKFQSSSDSLVSVVLYFDPIQ